MILLFSITMFSQEKEIENTLKSVKQEFKEEIENPKKHAISFILSHTHIQSDVDNAKGDDWIAAPSFGINYTY